MPTDLQRIEVAWPVEAMLHVVDHGADPSDSDVLRVRRLLIGRRPRISDARSTRLPRDNAET